VSDDIDELRHQIEIAITRLKAIGRHPVVENDALLGAWATDASEAMYAVLYALPEKERAR
jgi:hypothetical protein